MKAGIRDILLRICFLFCFQGVKKSTKHLFSLAVMLIVISSSVPAYPEEKYDPQNTILALNMAIVSFHRITTTQDRIVLQHEYDNIINKLALGNIESDYDMTGLY